MNNNLTEEQKAAARAAHIAHLKSYYASQKAQADTYNQYINDYKAFKGYLLNFQGVLTNSFANNLANAKNSYASGGYILEDGTTLDGEMLKDLLTGTENLNSKLNEILEYIDNKVTELTNTYNFYKSSAESTKKTLWYTYGVGVF